MMIGFKKSFLLLVVVLILFLSFSQGFAYIPEGSVIIKLAVETIVEPKGMKIRQKRKIYSEQKKVEKVIEKAICVTYIDTLYKGA